MPRLEAERNGTCAACGGPIARGEVIEYQRALGPRHLFCLDRAPEVRRNRYRASCSMCGVALAPGAGLLSVDERELQPGVWQRDWRTACADVGACNARLRGG